MTFDRAYITARVTVDPTTGCWNWNKSLFQNTWYGQVGKVIDGKVRVTSAHRASYAAFKGAPPPGAQIDHLCRNRRCCNPDHLEAVSQHVNIRRQYGLLDDLSVCGRGHSLEYQSADSVGKPYCRKCRAEAKKRRRVEKKEAALVQ